MTIIDLCKLINELAYAVSIANPFKAHLIALQLGVTNSSDHFQMKENATLAKT